MHDKKLKVHSKVKDIVGLIFRVVFTGILLYYIYFETGVATTIFFIFSAIAFELISIKIVTIYRNQMQLYEKFK